ncbi:MAG TPA: DAK2 domain-containing protein [Firmicutes bacterium]|nr:DAK2 domain-containing protein [Bacillota bacterium]
MQLHFLEGPHLRQMLLAGAALLQEKKEEINSLNVFPVPDGDTGTNMSLTMTAAVREVEKAKGELGSIAGALANGSLMGARGNSGVILSQLFRGFAAGLEGKVKASPLDFALALQEGVKTAYRGVMKPVEGTILTVAKEGAQAALAAARRGGDILAVLESTIRQAELTLERTPEILPVLKEAGVVDAGGKGLICILQGALLGLKGEDLAGLSLPPEAPHPVPEGTGEGQVALAYQYCTEFIIKGHGLDLEKIRLQLSELGDSLIAVGTGELVKIHIHTNHPGQALEIGLAQGTLHDVKIDNMAEQHREVLAAQPQEPAGSEPESAPQDTAGTGEDEAEDGIGVIAVALGEGIAAILESLGAERVVDGGQTMNPSTEDLVRSIEKSRYNKVILLPNNKNIILAAQQAQALAEKEVVVVPSKSIPQGIAALLAFDPEADLETNGREMTAAMEGIKTGEVTYAVRDSSFNGQKIRAGDILGLLDGKLSVMGKEPAEVVLKLLAEMVEDSGEILTIYYGEGVSSTAARELADRIRETYPQCEVEVYEGGQPLYYYIVAVE